MTRAPSRLDLVRLWLSEHPNAIGVALAAVVSVLAVGAIALVAVPRGPGEPASGVIVGMGYTETEDYPGHPEADVQTPDGPARVGLPGGSPCKVGDVIRLRRVPRLWGKVYVAEPNACAVERRR